MDGSRFFPDGTAGLAAAHRYSYRPGKWNTGVDEGAEVTIRAASRGVTVNGFQVQVYDEHGTMIGQDWVAGLPGLPRYLGSGESQTWPVNWRTDLPTGAIPATDSHTYLGASCTIAAWQ